MTELLRFVVPGLIVPKQSGKATGKILPGQRTKRGQPRIAISFRQPKHVLDFQNYTRDLAAYYWAGKPPLDEPLSLYVVFFLVRPKSRPRKCLFPDRKPDLDNSIKPIKDALEKSGVVANDSRFCSTSIVKLYCKPDQAPCTVVLVKRMEVRHAERAERFYPEQKEFAEAPTPGHESRPRRCPTDS